MSLKLQTQRTHAHRDTDSLSRTALGRSSDIRVTGRCDCQQPRGDAVIKGVVTIWTSLRVLGFAQGRGGHRYGGVDNLGQRRPQRGARSGSTAGGCWPGGAAAVQKDLTREHVGEQPRETPPNTQEPQEKENEVT